MTFIHDDGGRAAAGYKGDTGDCTVRAVAIATGMAYEEVYGDFFNLQRQYNDLRFTRMVRKQRRMKPPPRVKVTRSKYKDSPRDGVSKVVLKQYLAELGWRWTPTMGIGTGCQVHLRADELPAGRLIVQVSKHLVAVIDGAIHDTYDPSRDGTRCVYGYWLKP